MKAGDRLYGFKINESTPIDELCAILHEGEHEKSGAKLYFLEREEENKSFLISFETPPTDSTGVFHIIEHSVLNGSEKYPVKEPFVELLKGSLNTFLNANFLIVFKQGWNECICQNVSRAVFSNNFRIIFFGVYAESNV